MKVKVSYEKDIKRCYHDCPYFGSSQDGMECGHPYFKPLLKKNSYANMIISHPDCDEGFLKECPLFKEQ